MRKPDFALSVRLSRLGKATGLCLSQVPRRFFIHPSPPCPVPRKLFSKILLALVILPLLFEIICWLFVRFPVEPLRTLDLDNDIAGFKKNVRIIFGEDQVRYLDWTAGKKPEGTVRILCVGGFATLGMLQTAEDTWWGQLHLALKAKGLKIQTAARGFDRVTTLEMAGMAGPMLERLQPDVIILNTGYDDVIVHPADYTYDKTKAANLPKVEPPSAFKSLVLQVSQIARFRRWWNGDTEAKLMQNQMGRKDVYKHYFEEVKQEREKFPRFEGVLRTAGLNDPLPEYVDGLTAWRDLAVKQKARLILTGEATLQSNIISHTEEENLLAYIALKKPDAEGKAPAARPDPGWVMHEMNRFAARAESFAAENKLPWVDLNGRIDRNLDNFFTDVLLTDAGARAAAKVLEPVVEPVVRGK
jgi:hypothetical protein